MSHFAKFTYAGACVVVCLLLPSVGRAQIKSSFDPSALAPLEKYAYEAFCANESTKIRTVYETLGSQSGLDRARAMYIAWQALQKCPHRNKGPFFGDGAFWNQTPTSTVQFFFFNSGSPHRGMTTASVWWSVPSYGLSPERKMFGRAVRVLEPKGNIAVLAQYSLINHGIVSTYTVNQGFTGTFTSMGGSTETRYSWDRSNVLKLINGMPNQFPGNQIRAGRYSNPIDYPDCFGLPPLAYAAGVARYDAVLALLEKGANVDFEVPSFVGNQMVGVLEEFVEPDISVGGGELVKFTPMAQCQVIAEDGAMRRSEKLIVDEYKKRNATFSFFEYFLLTAKPAENGEQALTQLVKRVKAVPKGTLIFMFSRPVFGLNLAYPGVRQLVADLVAKGADVNATDEQGRTLLKSLMDKGLSGEGFRALTALGAQLEPPK